MRRKFGIPLFRYVARSCRHRAAEAIVQAVLASVRSHVGLARVHDDLTPVVLKRRH